MDAGTLFATFPLDVQAFVREAARMESRETHSDISPEAMVLVLVRACQSLQAWTARDRGLPPVNDWARPHVADPPRVSMMVAAVPVRPTETVRDAILAVLSDGTPATLSDIVRLMSARWQGFPIKPVTVRSILCLLHRYGRVVRIAHGVYATSTTPIVSDDWRPA